MWGHISSERARLHYVYVRYIVTEQYGFFSPENFLHKINSSTFKDLYLCIFIFKNLPGPWKQKNLIHKLSRISRTRGNPAQHILDTIWAKQVYLSLIRPQDKPVQGIMFLDRLLSANCLWAFLWASFRRGFLLDWWPCKPTCCCVQRMVWALTSWPSATSKAMLAALMRLFLWSQLQHLTHSTRT